MIDDFMTYAQSDELVERYIYEAKQELLEEEPRWTSRIFDVQAERRGGALQERQGLIYTQGQA